MQMLLGPGLRDKPTSSKHFTELDGMRGTLALLVMFHHLGLNTLMAKATDGLVSEGQWGLSVDFFFLLSGFVLCRSFLDRPVRLLSYAIKRFARLGPLMIACTIVSIIFFYRPGWDGLTVLANVLVVQSLIGLPSIDVPAWSVPFELFLPAAMLPALPFLCGARTSVLLGIAAVSFAGSGAAAFLLVTGLDLPWFRASTGLASGTLLYLVFARSAPVEARSSGWPALLLFLAAVLVMALSGTFPGASVAFSCLSALAIWFGARARGVLSTLPFRLAGRWSYSIYLLHFPVLWAFEEFIGVETVLGNAGLKAVLVATTLVAAAVGYSLIEKPFIDMANRVAKSAALPRGLSTANPPR